MREFFMRHFYFLALAIAVMAFTAGCVSNPCHTQGYGYNGCGNQNVVYGGGVCTDGCNVVADTCGAGYCVPPIGPPCFPIATGCTRGVLSVANTVGELAVNVVTLPFELICGICGSCHRGGCGYNAYNGGSYYSNGMDNGCGCSSEVYYGDNYIGGGCEPCEPGCGGGYRTGCSHCSGGYTEGISSPQVEELTPQELPNTDVRNLRQTNRQPLQVRQLQPLPQNQQRPVYQQVIYKK
jgi:hypothetical protein